MVGRRSFPFGFRPIFRCELLVSGRVSQYLLEISCFLKTNLQLFQSIFLLGCLIITTKVMQDGVVKQFHHTHHKLRIILMQKKKSLYTSCTFSLRETHMSVFFSKDICGAGPRPMWAQNLRLGDAKNGVCCRIDS